MSGEWSIDEPQTLFSVPPPVDQESGTIRAGRVYGFQGSKKRKRPEVVVGVDGECLNVYNIKTPRLLTTHALPPRTSLTSAPVSAYRPATEHQPAQRFTYAPTRNNVGATARRELICFQEDSLSFAAPGAKSSKNPIRWARDVTDVGHEIAHVEPLINTNATDGHESHDVLVVFANAQILVLSENFNTEKANGLVAVESAEDTVEGTEKGHDSARRVEFVSVHSASDAKSGLLRDRPDLITSLSPGSSIVLLIISAKCSSTVAERQYSLHICSVSPSNSMTLLGSSTRSMVSYHLPDCRRASDKSTERPQFAYEATSTYLHQLNEGMVSVYRLSATTPEVVSRFTPAQGAIGRVIAFSPAATIIFSGRKCGLYDTHYGSLQATRSFESLSATDTITRKRKRASVEEYGRSSFTPWLSFSSLGVVIGIKGLDIVSLGVGPKSVGRTPAKHGLLIDSLGKTRRVSKTTQASHLPHLEDDSNLRLEAGTKYDSTWKDVCDKIEPLSTELKAKTFDRFFFRMIKSMSGDPRASSTSHERDSALKALGVIFQRKQFDLSTSRIGQTSVKVAFVPRKAVQWIIKKGYLTAQNIGNALYMHDTGDSDLCDRVQEIDLVRAVAAADNTLKLLSSLVTSRRLSITGSVESFRILASSFDATVQNTLPEGITEGSDSAPQSRGGAEDELLAEQRAAAHDLQIAKAALEDDVSIRGSALKACLERLGTCFSLSELVQGFRSQLTRREIVMLIELLRIELEQAGWTSRQLDFHPSYDRTQSQNEAISVICKLLNCAIDAIGTGGWLSERDVTETDSVSALISLLRTESSAVLEGVQEATFFLGFLKDFMRFGDALKNGGNERSISVSAMKSSKLPLGLKSVQKPASTKIGAAGEIQARSARDIRYQNLQALGEYTFEQIRV